MPQLDFTTFSEQIFWLLVIFWGLYAVLSRRSLPRVAAAIEDRRDRIADDLDNAAGLKEQAEDLTKSYQEALDRSRTKAQHLLQEARRCLEADFAAETDATEQSLSDKIGQAEKAIRQTRNQALSNLEADACALVPAALTKIVAITVVPDDIAAIVKRRSVALIV